VVLGGVEEVERQSADRVLECLNNVGGANRGLFSKLNSGCKK
jgi:hypothetical protein